MKDNLKIGYLILILLCCTTCKKGDYRQEYVGVYKTSKFSLYETSSNSKSYASFGEVEISISNDAPEMLIATFDDSLDYNIPDVAKLLYLITKENKLYLQIDENGIINPRVYNHISIYIDVIFEISNEELNITIVNKVDLRSRITHILIGKRNED